MGACFGVPVLAGRLAPLRFAAARCQDGHAYAPTRLATLGAPSVGCSGLGTSLWRSLTYGLPTSNPQAHQNNYTYGLPTSTQHQRTKSPPHKPTERAAKPQRISCGDGAWACFLRSPALSAPYARRLRVASSLGGWRRYRRRPCSLRRRASALR